MNDPNQAVSAPFPAALRELPIEEGALVCFDADGVLWQGDLGEDFVAWLVAGPMPEYAERWQAYQAEYETNAPEGCLVLAAFAAGVPRGQLDALVARFWREQPPRWNPGPLAALRWLAGRGCEVWVVSGTVRRLLDPLRAQLPVSKILAVELEEEADGSLTGRHVGFTTWGAGKVEAIRARAPNRPVLMAVGDSHLDVQMLELAEGLAWAYRPDPTLRRLAAQRGWLIDIAGAADSE